LKRLLVTFISIRVPSILPCTPCPLQQFVRRVSIGRDRFDGPWVNIVQCFLKNNRERMDECSIGSEVGTACLNDLFRVSANWSGCKKSK
jgi:hypothetical protein